MVGLIKSSTFDAWFSRLKDRKAMAKIAVRIDRLAMGNSGEAKPIGGGLSEMRIDYGPGYRVYYMQRGQIVIVLLCGGDKSTQARDIAQAKDLAELWKDLVMTGEAFSHYDTADYLKTDEDIAAYLEAAAEESDDPAFLARALGVVARARNMSQLAREVGMSREGLNKALSGDGNPTLGTVMKVAKALGLRVGFRPAA
jgi:putative addiction module killer protein/probable addiction module antidote protein